VQRLTKEAIKQRKLVPRPVAVEKLASARLPENYVASGCPINVLLGFRIHFWSPGFKGFQVQESFSTATPDYNSNR
jgi:hypothetical protein